MGPGAGQTSQVCIAMSHCPLLLCSILTSVTRQTWPPPCSSVQSWLLLFIGEFLCWLKNFRQTLDALENAFLIEILKYTQRSPLLTISLLSDVQTSNPESSWISMWTAFSQFHEWINERVSLGSTASLGFREFSNLVFESRLASKTLSRLCKSMNLSSKSQFWSPATRFKQASKECNGCKHLWF